MATTPNLSYILVTRNKLPYLKTALADVIAHREPDEEIVVIDGGSTDGSAEYLKECLERGEIDQLLSEPDRCIGHGTNKGMLLAKGKLLKTLTDDDIVYYDHIQKCKAFMLEHPEIDVIGMNGITDDEQEYHREEDFLLWKTTPYHPFMFFELGAIFRKSSIPLFGLFDTSFVFCDAEYTIRITAGKSRLAWYTGIAWKHVSNPDSTNIKQQEVWRRESARLRQMYPGLYSAWKHHVPRPIRNLIRHFVPKKRLATAEQSREPSFLF
ncbi:MAG: glycosyltransferase [Patescibacteria group bacterium]|nr:glycosyltransferase [Patescibacteria group bacterium]MDE1943995.1 glycosyltransferase [Patescibacteria group bacterium]MDE1945065.1 glycosyltransferase [Patescibacteria group bacterium]MDE2057933.1 glycosyltransferase [Patescibacteria group bacterium]